MKRFLLCWAALVFVTAAAPPAVEILVGMGEKGFSETQVNNPYGMAIGPDGGLYFCNLDNQRIRRLFSGVAHALLRAVSRLVSTPLA